MEGQSMDEPRLRKVFCDALRRRVGDQRFATWFRTAAELESPESTGSAAIDIDQSDGGKARLTTASAFEQSMMRRQFHSELVETAIEVLGEGAQVIYGVREATFEASKLKPAAIRRAPRIEKPAPTPRPAAQPMKDWVVGDGNAPATRLCEQLIAGGIAPSPVLLWGPSGVGKTQLLRLVCDGIRARRRSVRVLSISGEQFLRGFVEAARGGGFPGFRQKHQGVDVLLIDDVQQLLGKTRTLEEFRQTIDSAIEAGAQIVLTADRGPTELRDLGPEIASRLAGGLSVEVPMPDAPMREQLVLQTAKRVGLELPASTAQALACRLQGGGREVSGAINRIALLHETFALPLDERLAQQVADDTNRLSTPPVRLADIQRAVCGVCGIDSKTLRSDKRTKAVTEPRMLAMWLARNMTGSAWSEIGDFFGRRSHSTVISAHRRVEKLLASSEPTRLVSGELGETIRRVEAALRTA